MKKLLAIAFVALFVFALACTESSDTIPMAKMKTQMDSVSYAYGVQIAEMLKQQNKDLDPNVVAAAVKEALENKAQLTSEQCQEVLFEEEQKAMEDSKKEGVNFLAENAKKEGVKVTASGLQYEVVTEGQGASPKAEDVVEVHYRGTLIDGTQFDSSYDRGQPTTFPLNQVIPGWTEGVQLMKAGPKYRFYIPSELAYGERGAGPGGRRAGGSAAGTGGGGHRSPWRVEGER